jgi:competence protein ComEC
MVLSERETAVRANGVAFFFGVLALFASPVGPSDAVLAWALAGAGLVALLDRRFGPGVFLVLGFAYAAQPVQDFLADRAAFPERHDTVIQGWIVDFPIQDGRRTRLTLQVRAVPGSDVPGLRGRSIPLSWYGRASDAAPLRGGQSCRLAVRLRPVMARANPGGRDWERWSLANNVPVRGYVRGDSTNGCSSQAAGFAPWLTAQRDRLSDRIASVGDRFDWPQARVALAQALTVGDRSGFRDADWARFQRTGTNHLVAISGLHLTLVTGWVFVLGRLGAVRVGITGVRWNADRIAALLALVAAVAYAALAGFQLPTQRALVMLAIGLVAIATYRWKTPWDALLWAAVAVVWVDPRAVLTAGFWFSFTAVAAILYQTTGQVLTPRDRRARVYHYGRRLTGVQLAIVVALIPLTLVFFHQTTWVSPLANLIAVPYVSLALVPSLLIGALGTFLHSVLGELVLGLGLALAGPLLAFLDALAGLPYTELVWVPPLWSLLPAAVGVLLLGAPRGFPGRWLGVVLLLPLVIAERERPPAEAFTVDLLDVGQGLAAVVTTQDHTLLFDTGPGWEGGADAGDAVVIPFLRSQGIQALDAVVLSHAEADHDGSADSILRSLAVDRVWATRPEVYAERADWPPIQPCRRGRGWEWNGVEFRFLHPPPGWHGSANNASCVLRIAGPGGRLLLTADVERAAESFMVDRQPMALRAEALLVPHHGSETSSGPSFLDRVDPEIGLIAVGRRNRFGFPVEPVVDRYRTRGIALWSTGAEGRIRLRFSPDEPLEPSGWRRARPRVWRLPPD